MKRILAALLVCISTTQLTHARILSIGPKIGVSVNEPQDIINLKMDNHHHIGIFGRFDLLLAHVQAEVLFSGPNTKTKEQTTLEFDQLDIPIMGGISIMHIGRLYTGPSFSVPLSSIDIKQYTAVTSINDAQGAVKKQKDLSMAWHIGAGIDLCNVTADLRYDCSSLFPLLLGLLGQQDFLKDTLGRSPQQGKATWMFSVGFHMI